MSTASPFHQEFDSEFGTASDAPPASPAAAPVAGAAAVPAPTAAPVAGAVPVVAPAPVVPGVVVPSVTAPVAPGAGTPPAPVADGAQAPLVFRREIDMGDGSGKQVFEASTEAALLDKLTEAQTHGTRKIRQQQRQLKRLRQTPAAPAAAITPAPPANRLTQEEEFMLGQQFAEAPVASFNRLLEATTGMKATEFVQTVEDVRQFKAAQAAEAAAKEFVADHQGEFAPTPANERRVLSFLEKEGLAMTRDNLEIAFDELSASGLLEAVTAAPPAQQVVIPPVAPAGTVSTGISAQGSGPLAPPAGNPSALNASEVDALPLADARQRILYELHRMRTGQTPTQ